MEAKRTGKRVKNPWRVAGCSLEAALLAKLAQSTIYLVAVQGFGAGL